MESVKNERQNKTSKAVLEMYEAAVVSPAAPCLATLRINPRSKTNILKLWKLGATTGDGDLSGTLKQTVGGQLMQRSSNNKLNQSELLVKKNRRRRRVFFSQVSLADPVIAVSSL